MQASEEIEIAIFFFFRKNPSKQCRVSWLRGRCTRFLLREQKKWAHRLFRFISKSTHLNCKKKQPKNKYVAEWYMQFRTKMYQNMIVLCGNKEMTCIVRKCVHLTEVNMTHFREIHAIFLFPQETDMYWYICVQDCIKLLWSKEPSTHYAIALLWNTHIQMVSMTYSTLGHRGLEISSYLRWYKCHHESNSNFEGFPIADFIICLLVFEGFNFLRDTVCSNTWGLEALGTETHKLSLTIWEFQRPRIQIPQIRSTGVIPQAVDNVPQYRRLNIPVQRATFYSK